MNTTEREFINAALVLDTINTVLDSMQLNRLQDKRTRTNGGEWAGPCPRCKKEGRGTGGEDRLVVWPNRPYYGGKPSFWCRQCPGEGWSGDLANFLEDILGMSKGEARKALGVTGTYNPDTDGPVTIEPKLRSRAERNLDWISYAWQFAEECREILLHQPEGAKALAYLLSRGLSMETIEMAYLGFQPQEQRYDKAELWGLTGDNLWIPRGIVFPEFHRNADGAIEIPAMSIRRSDAELRNEYIETGKHSAKYFFIRDSNKGLYAAESIKRGQPMVMVESPMCSLTVIQEAGNEFGVGGTQSNTGARDLAVTTRYLSKAEGILLSFGFDDAAEVAADWWHSHLPQGTSLKYRTPDGMDINKMHVNGLSVREFLLRGLDKYQRIYGQQSRQNETQSSLVQAGNTISQAVNAEPSSADTAPVIEGLIDTSGLTVCKITTQEHLDKFIDYLMEKGCLQCGAPVTHFALWNGNHMLDGFCDEHKQPEEEKAEPEPEPEPEQEETEEHLCTLCGEPALVSDIATKMTWCHSEFATIKLLVDGAHVNVGYCELYVPASDDGEAMVVPEGRSSYLEFALQHNRLAVWRAATEAHQVAIGFKPSEPPVVVQYCVRRPAGCHHRTNPVQMFDQKVYHKKRRELVYKYPAWPSQTVTVGTQELTFCPYCTYCASLLELVDELNYPVLPQVPTGDWVLFITQANDIDVMAVFDMLRKKCAEGACFLPANLK